MVRTDFINLHYFDLCSPFHNNITIIIVILYKIFRINVSINI